MTDSLTKELLKFDLTLMLDASQINGMDHTLKLSSLSVCSSNHISEKRYRERNLRTNATLSLQPRFLADLLND